MQTLMGESLSLTEYNLHQLKEIFPEVFCEDKIDFDKLRLILGDNVEEKEERYEFTWNGKSDAIRIAQTPSTGTLRPDRESSKNWDDTENLYIEGDNLEVLKLLQKSYFGKVKMIYIDPPYNTGKDFVYKDNFRDNIANYKEITSQTTRANPETNGRYHTDWLNMMYPRLKLARNLLRDDGVIFISIDDNELENLKKVCNEVFGEENFVGNITWEKRTKCQNTITARELLQSKVEYILVYKKKSDRMYFKLETVGEKEYLLSDERGVYREKYIEEMSNLGMRGRNTMIFPILDVYPKKGNQWKIGVDQVNYYKNRNDLFLKDGKPTLKIRPMDEDNKIFKPFWSHFFDKEVYGTAEVGKQEISQILDTKNHGFETVKPLSLIKKLISHVKMETSKDDIILDFFSGSSTTAHAVMEINSEDGGNRRFIMVQLPESTHGDSEHFSERYKTICDIGKKRIINAGNTISNKHISLNLDIGFKVFKLDSSNLKSWDSSMEGLEENLLEMGSNLKKDRSREDLLYEILLKSGVELTAKIEKIKVGYNTLYNIGQGALLACLDDKITQDVIDEIPKHKSPFMETKVIFKEAGFMSDAAKINAIQNLKQFKIEDVRSV